MVIRIFLGLCGLFFVTGICRLVFVSLKRRTEKSRWPMLADLALLLALVPVALLSVYPYLGANLVGAGDSYHYSLQVADFVTQSRQGVMPVFLGQSVFGFNGNIHTLRTAPYYTHLAGLWDYLTDHRLSFVALQNLTVVTTAILSSWAAFAAGLIATRGQRIISWLLATLYVFSPAIMGPLAINDMFATYMAAPWTMLCWCGLAEMIEREDDRWPQCLAAGGLALTWYAHSPIAAWMSIVWVLVQTAKAILGGGKAAHWLRVGLVALLLGGLLAYVFASVSSISAGSFVPAGRAAAAFNADELRSTLRAEFSPFQLTSGDLEIHLGWTIWLLLPSAAVLSLWFRNVTGLFLVALAAVFAAFLVPLPGASEFLWRILPERLVLMTTWPRQRLCPILAGGIVVAAATAFRNLGTRPRAAYGIRCGLLLFGCGWSLWEATAINRRPGFAKLSAAVHAPWYSPENVHLTHSAYDWLGKLPGYFTNGWADPEFESRLLNSYLEVVQSDAIATLAAAGTADAVPLNPTATLSLAGNSEYLLVFDFTTQSNIGEITIHGSGIQRHYSLPRSGNALAFGSEPDCEKTIPVRLSGAGTQSLIVGANTSGISVKAVPVSRTHLPIQLDRLIPYSASIMAAEASYLETPRMYLAGYSATVNGRPAPVRQSPNGLALIPVPAGASKVVLAYPGSILLRTGWFLSFACFAAFPWVLTRAIQTTPIDSNRSYGWVRENNAFAGFKRGLRQHRHLIVTSLWMISFAGGLFYGTSKIGRTYRSYGPLKISFQLTKKLGALPEPLVTLGETGAADCIYIKADGPHAVRFGFDHWSYGGPLCDSVDFSYAEPHVIEIDIGGLYPSSRLFGRKGAGLGAKASVGPLTLKLDGKIIMEGQLPFYSTKPDAIYVGSNPTGGSVTNDRFSGTILSTERLKKPGKAVTEK